ncbi:MAG TPA: adenosylcobinamide-phosphate synthase CbiB [Macromonas sp.]|nr:adenosylcobinamide-phosphate synthase CbiB [Macromonas sp.]
MPSGGVLAVAVLVALAVDHLWGEPPARWHPVVWMGRLLGWAGPLCAPVYRAADDAALPHTRWRAFSAGAVAWCMGALLVAALAMGVQAVLQLVSTTAPDWNTWVQALLLGLLLKPLLAWRMLRQEVAAVESALGQSLAQGQQRLAWLCSRDVTTLDAAQVRETALETLAENLNDSVVAPLFWFAVAGLPGAAVYRWANTADAMWGYRGERHGRDWTWAGKWAARADDVLSWLPARLTGVLLYLLGVAYRRRQRSQGHAGSVMPSVLHWRGQARLTPSPNGGWPMAALALALGVRLGKPGVYALNDGARAPSHSDTAAALRLTHAAVAVLAVLALLVAGGSLSLRAMGSLA